MSPIDTHHFSIIRVSVNVHGTVPLRLSNSFTFQLNQLNTKYDAVSTERSRLQETVDALEITKANLEEALRHIDREKGLIALLHCYGDCNITVTVSAA